MNFDLQLSAMQPEGYIELMQECWNPDPKKRPTAADLMNKIITIKAKNHIINVKLQNHQILDL